MAVKTSIWFDGREYRWNDAWNDYVLYGGDGAVKYRDAKRLRYRNDLGKTVLRYAAQGATGAKGYGGSAQGAQGIKGVQGVSGISGARPSIWYRGYKYDWDEKENEYVRWVRKGNGPATPFTLKEAKEKDRKDGDKTDSPSGLLTYKGFASTQEGLEAFGESLKELAKTEDLEGEKKDVYSLIAHLCDKWNQENKDKYPDKSEFEENRNKAFAEIGATYGSFLEKINSELKRRKEGDAPKTEIPTFEYNGLTSSPDDLEKFKKQIEGLETSKLESEDIHILGTWADLINAWEKENKDKLSKEEFKKQKDVVFDRLFDERKKFSDLVEEELKRRKEQESAAKEALKNHEFTFAHNGFEPTPEGLKAYAESLKTMPKSDLKKEYFNVNHSLSEGFKEWSNEAKKYWKSYEITEFYNNEYEPLRGDAYDKFEAVIDGEIERREKEVNDIAISLQLFSNGNHFALDEFGLSDYRRAIKKYSQDDLKKETETIQRNVDGKKDAWNRYYKRLVQSELQDEYEEALFARFDEYQKKFEQAVKSEIARRQNEAVAASRQGPLKITKVEPYNPDISSFPEEFAGSFEVVDDEIGGSTGAKLVKDANGAHYIMKRGNSEAHIVNEARADAFYQAAGVKVPAFKLYDDGTGAPVKISAEIKNAKPLDEWWNDASEEERSEMQKKIRKDFAVDVLMGNWDVVGDGDVNILVDSEGTPWRIDNGCSMGFRGRGDRKPKESWGEFCDDLFTMTGAGASIGQNVWTRIPEFFGELRPLDLAIEIASRDWTRSLATLSDVDAEVVKKRLAEIRQIAERGMENEKFGRTAESTDEVIAFSYQMCKDGVREALPKKIELDENFYKDWQLNVGWFYYGNRTETINGKSYYSFGHYLADKMGEEEYNAITEVNIAQGRDSYKDLSVDRKLCILKSQGFDCLDTKYKDFDDFYDEITRSDYYCGLDHSSHKDEFKRAFDEARQDPQEFNRACHVVEQYDAAIQLILENVDLPGVDRDNRRIFVCRTEESSIICDENGNQGVAVGERTYHNAGVCESHSHIKPVSINGTSLTSLFAPFPRCHGLWFIQPGRLQNGTFNPISDSAFRHTSENEIPIDSHGLPKVYDGEHDVSNTMTLDEAYKIHSDWENTHPDESV